MDIFSTNPCSDPRDLSNFIKDTLNKSQKDRITLLKLEHDMVALIRDPTYIYHYYYPLNKNIFVLLSSVGYVIVSKLQSAGTSISSCVILRTLARPPLCRSIRSSTRSRSGHTSHCIRCKIAH